ncbi:MAG: phytoene desaturase [Rubrivivax sp.]|nr:phytoene desaturase [Rubrivivax sp.]
MAAATADRVVVVGAGIGGLVAALELALRGLDVTLLEAADGPGGKMRALNVGGQRIDAGPTVFTMRWVFDRILAEAGTTLEALVDLQPLDTLARHAWRGHGPTLDLHADAARSAEAIARFASPAEARRFSAFCAESRRVYRRLEGPHIRSSRPSLGRMVADLGPRGLAELSALGPFASLWRTLGRHFHDPRLRQLFARYATYCGASPWLAPATLMLVAHVEQEGVWSITGGMDMLAQRLAALAAVRGVRLRYGAAVQRIELRGGAVAAVHLLGGERLAADHVVFNGDADALAQGLLGPDLPSRLPPPLPAAKRSLSALTWVMTAHARGLPLARHNVFFDDDYASEFDDVFRRRRLPRRGTVYVCAQDRLDGHGAAPAGAERLLVLVNAPADGDRASLSDLEMDRCTERMQELLQACRLTLEPSSPAAVQRRGPTEFARLFPGSGGALYGPATHGWMALFRRAGAATAVPGLFLAGGSVHPGPGVPMAAMSGSLAAATLMAHRDSTSRSRRVRISGGTSTPSATTVAMRSR